MQFLGWEKSLEFGNPFSAIIRTCTRFKPPGTLDGGDICEAGSHFFIGISHRTNEEGARQLAEFLAADGYTVFDG